MLDSDKKLIEAIKLGNTDYFYNSRRWRRLAVEIKERDNNECQQCKERGYVGPAECVHHLVEIKINPMLALTSSNLKTLCNKCHNIIHGKHGPRMYKEKKFINEERW